MFLLHETHPQPACRRTAAVRYRIAALALGLSLTGIAAAQTSAATGPIAIEPMTQVSVATHTGYFSDPYPIHFSQWLSIFEPQTFSGTTKDLLTCRGKIQPGCFTPAPITVDLGSLPQQAEAAGSTIVSTESIHPYQDLNSHWQMVASLHLSNPAFPDKKVWSVIVHAHATDSSPHVPTAFLADTVLIGSLDKPAPANYDGKYFEDDDKLYLVYSKRLEGGKAAGDKPAHDGIVAQLMDSPTQLAKQDPITLIEPNDANGGFNSEYFYGVEPKNPFKLIETGNIVKIQGKYALAYSTGAYDLRDYKTAVAWSDTFLPASGAFYKKVLMPDPTGVWGQPGQNEVRYLLQSQEPAWPNYVATEVLAPGVPSFVQEKNLEAALHGQEGDWFLYFAGYDPNDDPKVAGTDKFIPSKRRPYFVRLRLEIPANATVATTPNADLASWLNPVAQ